MTCSPWVMVNFIMIAQSLCSCPLVCVKYKSFVIWSFSRRIWLMTSSSDHPLFFLTDPWNDAVFVWSLSDHSTQLPLFFLTDVWNYSVMKILSHESGKKWMMMSWIPWSVKLLCDSFFSDHSTPIVFVLSHWCVKLQCNENSFSQIG